MNEDKLNLLWTTDHPEQFFHMAAMYTLNSQARGWWKQVNLIIWGPSARLAGTDPKIQTELREILAAGATVEACKDCADRYGVSEVLEKIGVRVRYMGEPMTGYLKNGEKFLTV
ncbi:MAG: DsrE family protein [Rikenellaceae bacterium]|nr:DsrE family protein [Rikenellaceae bacterium]